MSVHRHIVPRLAVQSLRNRALTAFLTVLAIAFSVMLLLGVEKVRTGARQSFADTISGTDLVVGARSGSIQLLLYSVFRIGNATNNVTWKSYEDIAKRPEVAWIVPMSLGDSHHGFRVLGTTADYFERYKYRHGQSLKFTEGGQFKDLFDAVIGADVAKALGYKVGDPIVVAHGLGSVSFVEHQDKPFRVSGILAKTGTPVDRTVHVSLEAIEAIHVDWQNGMPQPGQSISADDVRQMDLKPKAITAALVGLKSKLATFKLQRAINEYGEEPLSAIMPGAALQELWGLVGTAEMALSVVSAMVVATALLGMVTMILTTLNERRREMAILRSVGARPTTVLGLLATEAGLLTLAGVALGVVLLYAALLMLRPWLDATYGLNLDINAPTSREWLMLGGIVVAGFLAGLLPAIRAYRLSLADGMTVRT
ncbi:MAG: ABC transporter permease [Hyphomicrobium sp.]